MKYLGRFELNKPEVCMAKTKANSDCDSGKGLFYYDPSDGSCGCCTSADALTNTGTTPNFNIYSSCTPNKDPEEVKCDEY